MDKNIPGSTLSLLFDGRWEDRLEKDQNGNLFFEFNPILFCHLLNQLQMIDINSSFHLYPPSQPSLIQPFKKMIKNLDLHHFSSPEKQNIITFNVGGRSGTHRRMTFTPVSNSTFDTIVRPLQQTNFNNETNAFLDYDPKLFQHLVGQLRQGSSNNISYMELPSIDERISFEGMLVHLSIYRKNISFSQISLNMKWKQNGLTIAGGNGQGVRMDQLNLPRSVIVDRKTDSLVICDAGNKRVVRWPRRNGISGEIIISDIDCNDVTIDNNGDLYVSDWRNDEVRRWKKGETNGIIVADGNSKGDQLKQLSDPAYLFIDQDHSIYISDDKNHRVMKWLKGAQEGIIVAGGQGQGSDWTRLSRPWGVITDGLGQVYVADRGTHRIMRWSKGSKEGHIVVGGNRQGNQSNQLIYPMGLLFDRQGNLYVADRGNHRIQKFEISLN